MLKDNVANSLADKCKCKWDEDGPNSKENARNGQLSPSSYAIYTKKIL